MTERDRWSLWSNWPCIIKTLCIVVISLPAPRLYWGQHRVGYRDHLTTIKREEIFGFLVYPTPAIKNGNILWNPGYSELYPSHPVPHSSRENVTMSDSRLWTCTPVTPELKGILQHSPLPADYALVRSDKSFWFCIYRHKYIQCHNSIECSLTRAAIQIPSVHHLLLKNSS